MGHELAIPWTSKTTGALEGLAKCVLELADRHNVSIATAESCTGGALAALLTDIEGFPHRFERGFVSYSDRSKADLLDVPQGLIDLDGPVTAPVAKLMAKGAQYRSQADLAVAITGFAGPAGPDDEPGLVHFATCDRFGELHHEERRFPITGRSSVRQRSLQVALEMLHRRLLDWSDRGSRASARSFLLRRSVGKPATIVAPLPKGGGHAAR